MNTTNTTQTKTRAHFTLDDLYGYHLINGAKVEKQFGNKQAGDEWLLSSDSLVWIEITTPAECWHPNFYYRRKVQIPEGFRLLGLDEPFNGFNHKTKITYDGVKWFDELILARYNSLRSYLDEGHLYIAVVVKDAVDHVQIPIINQNESVVHVEDINHLQSQINELRNSLQNLIEHLKNIKSL